MSHFHNILQKNILEKSRETSDFDQASKEWTFVNITESKSGVCLCTHNIIYDFWIENKHTKELVNVGSACIDYFEQNRKLIESARTAEVNYKRKQDRKKELGECERCGIRTIHRINGVHLHKKCDQKNSWDAEKEAKNRERIANHDARLMFMEEVHKYKDHYTFRDTSFIESILKSEQGITDKQNVICEKIIKKLKKKAKDKNNKPTEIL